jgi:sulfur-oxidizing protein SoxA
VARQSRGQPIDIAIDPRTQPFLDAGRATWDRRQGQLNLACSQCHDAHWGRQLAGNVIPQAHPTGYPLYRLEWQGLGSLRRQVRNCRPGSRGPTCFRRPRPRRPQAVPDVARARMLLEGAPAVRLSRPHDCHRAAR